VRRRFLRLSANRRFIADAMRISARVPTVSVQRRMQLRAVAAARVDCAGRPSWAALFTKSFALVADEFPELRRAYISYPWPHLYEQPENAAMVLIERRYRGESAVFPFLIRKPAWLPVVMLSEIIRNAKSAPIEAVTDFQLLIRVSSLPRPLRRLVWWTVLNSGRLRANYCGTFVVSAFSSMGVELLYSIVPGMVLLTPGIVAADGGVDVRAMWDHRVFDGAVMARALVRMEEVLCTTIVEELRSSSARSIDVGPAADAAAQPLPHDPRISA